MVQVACEYCHKEYVKEVRRYNEAIRYTWKQYCSPQCLSNARDKRHLFTCFNSNCKKTFKRRLKEISHSGKVFCSQSCAAIISNKYRWLKLPKNYCKNPNCNKIIPKGNIYCSNKCQGVLKKFSDDEYKSKIIERIQKFYKNKKRIPFKHEMWGSYKAARRLFGTWNSAIIVAGFKPNPVRFAIKYIANDGHKCDSLAEKIIDDWLFKRKIHHEIKVAYGINRMTADFKVNKTYIEFFGLKGEVERYDELVSIKEKLWKEKKLKTIAIYPKDLFPRNRLNGLLGSLH